MPKSKNELPETLRPFNFHGLDLNFSSGDKEAVADCPFCGKEEKFTVNIGSGMWRCFSCSTGSEKGGGNVFTFLNSLYEESKTYTSEEHLEELAAERNITNLNLLEKWGLVKSLITDDWLFPSYTINEDKKLRLIQLYKYTKFKGKSRLFATSEVKQGLFGVQFLKQGVKQIFLVEGPWDAIALLEVLTLAKKITGTAVLAVPGCNTFREEWSQFFSGKSVSILFDNDHPRVNSKTQKEIPPAGFTGVKRTAKILLSSKKPPKELNYLYWGENGFDTNLDDGMDVRDILNNA